MGTPPLVGRRDAVGIGEGGKMPKFWVVKVVLVNSVLVYVFI